jgi:DNA-binding MarR family transcriptional regulator
MDSASLDDEQYGQLLGFRSALRQFLRWSEDQAAKAGLTPQQHQLLLAIRGHGSSTPPSVGDVAGYLLLRHHSAVELVDRAERAGLVTRHEDRADRRLVRLGLTAKGRRVLERLSAAHLEELRRLAPMVASVVAVPNP